MNLPRSIRLHSDQARHYKYREPYLPVFLRHLVRTLQLTPASRLFDLCCGCGELASGLAGQAGRIYAVDGSREMLALAPRRDNVEYFEHDLNAQPFRMPAPIDHFVIGRAIHWLEPAALQALVDHNLKPGGLIAVCSTQWQSSEPWYAAYLALVAPYRDYERLKSIDFRGTHTLQSIGYEVRERISYTAAFSCDLDYLVGNTLSSTYDDHLERLEAELGQFRATLAAALAPHLRNGQLGGELTSWSLVYGPAGP